MSGSMTLALRTAQSGLLSNQQALDAVANNIANVNSPGYSRKVVNMEQRVVSGAGAGVQVSDVVRKVNEGLLKSLRLEMSTLNAFDSRQPYYERIQELFGTPESNTSLSHVMAEFKNAAETLALNPNSTMEQSEVIRRAQAVADKLNFMSDTVQELRLQTDTDIKTATDRITVLTSTIHDLNNKLIANKAISADVTDLQDQRDLAIDELSGLIDVRYYHRSDGDVVVFTEGGRSLVDNASNGLTHLQASAVSSTTTYSEGDLNGIFLGSSSNSTNDITNEIRNGTLRGLLDMRDSVLTNIQSQLDEFASELRDVVNAVHNQGAPWPGLKSATGSRIFIDSADQTITYTGTEDTTVALMDSTGNQSAVTTIRTLLGGASGNIDQVASTLQTWLRNNGMNGATVAVNADGKFALNLNSTSFGLMFRDQTATTNGSTAQNASITFDANGADAGGTETVSGFSNFLGLNDMFVDDLADNIYETDILASGYTLAANTDLQFFTKTLGVGAGGLGTVNLTQGQTIDQIISAINTANIGVTATKVIDGSGSRMRITENQGNSMVISASNTFMTDTNLSVASVRTSTQIKVRDDLQLTPALVSTGALQWDATRGAAGEYLVGAGDDTVIQALSVSLSSTNQFTEAGGLTSLKVTFMSYATSIISYNSALSNTNETTLTYQQSLTDSLQAKSDNFRGVNLDEEMTNLMLFEQAYGAAARVVSTVQKMFDALENVI